jgi:hypothetical protein
MDVHHCGMHAGTQHVHRFTRAQRPTCAHATIPEKILQGAEQRRNLSRQYIRTLTAIA